MPEPTIILPKLILHEDEHLLVVNKPAGWNTHAPSPYAGEGVYEWLRHREPRWATLAILQRLDKETSGVMIFAKTREANRSLAGQFAEHTVRKKYLLVTDHAVKRREFTVVSNLVRAGEKYVSHPAGTHGERAETGFRVIDSTRGSTVVEARPVTGRTHQIRVQAAAGGFPIFGDELYGGTAAARVHLHAAELTLRHPGTGREVTFVAQEDFEADARQSLRAAILEPGRTTAWRMIHGASDGRAGKYVERLGDFVLVQSSHARSDGRKEAQSLLTSAPTKWNTAARGVYAKLLDRQVRKSTAAEASPQLIEGEPAPERFEMLENGLRF